MIRIIFRFIITFVAVVGSVWGFMEGYTYFTGDDLKNRIGDYWFILLYGLPFVISSVYVFCHQEEALPVGSLRQCAQYNVCTM